MTGLINRAIKDRDLLAYTEAYLLTDELVDHQTEKLFHERTRLSAADHDLTHRALDTVMEQDKKTAQANAYHLHQQ